MNQKPPPDDPPGGLRRRAPLPYTWVDWAAVEEAKARRRAAGLDTRLNSLTPFVRHDKPPPEIDGA